MAGISRVSGDMVGLGPFNVEEISETIHVNHQQAPAPSSYQGFFYNPLQTPNSSSFGVANINQPNHPLPLVDGIKDESLNFPAEKSKSFNGLDGLLGSCSEKEVPKWERVKWTDEMVKVLITAVSYLEEDALAATTIRGKWRTISDTTIRGKWRAISDSMIKSGYIVLPQQCEDKFNDLNRKYKRLTDLLGINSCEVVQNPALSELMKIHQKTNKEVKKVLACRQLFHPEMCSLYNRNRKFLPHDEALKQSVRLGLKGKAKSGSESMILKPPVKKQKRQGEETNVISSHVDSPALLMRENKLQMQQKMVESEQRKYELLIYCQEQDRVLQKMKLENEIIKLENEHLALELTRRGINVDHIC